MAALWSSMAVGREPCGCENKTYDILLLNNNDKDLIFSPHFGNHINPWQLSFLKHWVAIVLPYNSYKDQLPTRQSTVGSNRGWVAGLLYEQESAQIF